MIAAFAILAASLGVIAMVTVMLTRRRYADARVPIPRSHTTVVTAAEVEQVAPSAQARRRLPGIMPTAGHAVVSRRRSTIRPSVQAMTFDETETLV